MFKAPNTKPNYVYSIASMALVLFLLGAFGLLVFHGQQMLKTFRERVEIMVELKPETAAEALDSLKISLGGQPFCKAGSVRFVGKEEGAMMMQEELGEEFLKLDMANPLYDVLLFNVKADYFHPDSLVKVRELVRESSVVSDVYYQENVADLVAGNLKDLGMFFLVAGIVAVIIAIALILNTIRLALYANRFLIKNMELVGASWGFISRPYLAKSIMHGFMSALLAIAGLALLMYVIYNYAFEIKEFINWQALGALTIVIILLGIIISYLSTYYVVKKYLKMRVDDLY